MKFPCHPKSQMTTIRSVFHYLLTTDYLLYQSLTKLIFKNLSKLACQAPRRLLKSCNSNNPNSIHAKKSWRVYPVHFGILKK